MRSSSKGVLAEPIFTLPEYNSETRLYQGKLGEKFEVILQIRHFVHLIYCRMGIFQIPILLDISGKIL